MAIRSSNQVTLIDLTDGYSVILTNESHTFLGNVNTAISGQTATTTIQALQGAKSVPCTVNTADLQLPAGISVTSNNESTPTLTFSVTEALVDDGIVRLPIQITGKGITIEKVFSWSIAFRGQTGGQGEKGDSITISSQSISYKLSDSGTITPSDTGWSSDPLVATIEQPFLWTRTVVVYSDGNSTTTYSVGSRGIDGSNGTSVKIDSKAIEYAIGKDGVTTPKTWSKNMQSPNPGEFLWTRTTVNYTDGTSTVSYSVAKQGETGAKGDTGAKGEDAYSMNITSSNGTIFKNTSIATVLTAHVYKGGEELNTAKLNELKLVIKWYRDGQGTPVKTGQTLTLSAGDVLSQATYIAQLETM